MAPRYKVLEQCFFAPNLVEAGSIIETEATPGPHMAPLNAEAEARYEAWLTEEVDELDPKTRVPTGKKIRPHERYRRVAYVGAQQDTAEIISGPKKEDVVGQSLHEINLKRNTDQRPKPKKEIQVEPEDLVPPSAAVIEAGPPATSVKRSVP